MATSREIKEEYTSSLADLTFNSKPLITMLTMLAEENSANARVIVEAIEEHLAKVRTEVKLPVLYLIDCIMKNVGGPYIALFCQNIVPTFCSVFELVDEKIRADLFKLRQTWNDIIPPKKLYALDVQINMLDPAWPVIAPPPNSIHFNPKFLMKSGTAAAAAAVAKPKKPVVTSTTTTTVTKPVATPIASTALDPATLDMQQKLINKQRELLELQQKKLELELLQTQVKLQEQLKNSGGAVPANILLKPEVAKQLVKATVVKTTIPSVVVKPKPVTTTAPSSALLQKVQSTVAGPKIAPASSALVAANARPIRDPRLLKQQQQQKTAAAANDSDTQLESKQQQTIDSNNKIVNNKMGIRDSRSESRLVIINKSNVPSQDKTNKTAPHSPPNKSVSKYPDSPRKASKSSRGSSKTSSSESSDSKGGSAKSSTSSLDSPSKTKTISKSQSPSKSPKHKKKDSGSSHSDKKSAKIPKSDKSVKSHSKSETSPTIFKGLKGTMKNRNYIRRNRNVSISPEPSHDVDLRINGPPEKQARLQGDSDDKSTTKVVTCMDVDLRQLPGAITKKRPSTEVVEPTNAKKSKSEIFDVLFGGEDTDLRQLSNVMSPTNILPAERPPTPPPPIISAPAKKPEPEKKEPEVKESSKSSNFEAIRAKLANATSKSREFANKSFAGSKIAPKDPLAISNKSEFLEKRNDKGKSGDIDLRLNQQSPEKQMNKIIISQADEECIKAGNMTKAQEKALINKIIAQMETQKLREAQRKEEEAFGNVSLQPISDDELEVDFSDDEVNESSDSKSQTSRDKDERVPPFHHNSNEDHYSKFQRNPESSRDVRRTPWVGGHRRHFDNVMIGPRPGLRSRMGPEPWIRQLTPPTHSPWRPIGANFIRPPMNPEFIPHNEDILGPKGNLSPNQNSQDANDMSIDCASQDNLKTINIDGVPRDIRYYDETAIVFMSWDDPREITFQNGSRRVMFDDNESFVLSFNDTYREVTINGHVHKVKLGGPTREFYIDGKWYECYFGGPSVGIELDGKLTILKMEGPPPQVKIGTTRRTDLVVGKVSLIIDAKNIVPIFLDAKTQTFTIDGKVQTLRFTDGLKTALINDSPFIVEFGGLPKSISVDDKKHFIRFSVLPRGIKPGQVSIKDMEGCKPVDDLRIDENSQDSHPAFENRISEPALPVVNKRKMVGDLSPERNSNSPQLFQSILQQQSFNNLDVLSNVISTAMVSNSSCEGYQVENVTDSTISQPESQAPATAATVAAAAPQPVIPPVININELFQKLVATGIVTTATQVAQETPAANTNVVPSKPAVVPPKRDNLTLKPVYFDKPETLKIRQSALYQLLYTGMQCSSCGMRFPPEHSIHYSQHLDWHFRQNRKGKKNIRKAASRRWYYSLSDWKNYEEIEDLEEREKNYFDQQQQQGEGNVEEMEEEIEIPSVPADPNVQNAHCEVCQDKFEQFYNEEKEEWHLRMAVRVDDKTYHPVCYEDYQASLANSTLEDSTVSVSVPEQEEKVIPGLEVILDDDSEAKSEDAAELVVEESSDSKLTEEKEPPEEANDDQNHKDDDDDDVILNEVVPEKIVVDDEDDKDDYKKEELVQNVVIKTEPIDDGFIDFEDGVLKMQNGNEIKIKTEPVDPDESIEEPMDTSNVTETFTNEPVIEPVQPSVDSTHTELVSSIDGNVEFDSGVPKTSNAAFGGKIKINISKPLPAVVPPKEKEVPSESDIPLEPFIDPSQPLPPGEEPVQLNLKPALQGVHLKKLPPVKKGTELTGLCSIM